MAISQRAKDLTENIYLAFGSGTGWLFGISPDLRLAVEGIVQCVLDQVEEVENGHQRDTVRSDS